jgi:hypothetical protein
MSILRIVLFNVFAFAVAVGFASIALSDEQIDSCQGLPFCEAISLGHLVRVVPEKAVQTGKVYEGSDARVIISGFYPQSCYRVGPTEVDVEVPVDREIGKVTLVHQAYRSDERFCSDIQLPFQQKIGLGRLPAGQYRLVALDIAGHEMNEGTLTIDKAAFVESFEESDITPQSSDGSLF